MIFDRTYVYSMKSMKGMILNFSLKYLIKIQILFNQNSVFLNSNSIF